MTPWAALAPVVSDAALMQAVWLAASTWKTRPPCEYLFEVWVPGQKAVPQTVRALTPESAVRRFIRRNYDPGDAMPTMLGVLGQGCCRGFQVRVTFNIATYEMDRA